MCPTVLILDGDPWRREALAAALAYEGYRAEQTGEMAEAMALLARESVHLVLLAPISAATGGWGTIERLVVTHPDVPVFVLAQDEENEFTGSNEEKTGVIVKPVDFQSLVRAVKHALSRPAQTYVVRFTERERQRNVPLPLPLMPPAVAQPLQSA